MEILGHAVAETAGFSHIDDFSLGVMHDINAGGTWKDSRLIPKIGEAVIFFGGENRIILFQ